jgi:hypothetical protein
MYYDIPRLLKNSVLLPADIVSLVSLVGGAGIVRNIFYPDTVWKDRLLL